MRSVRRRSDRELRRVVGIDVARCLALIGMMATHMLSGYVDGGVPWPQQVAGGRAAALFAVLAGVSLALMSGRSEPVRGRERVAVSSGLAVRALIIAAIGMALGGLESGVAVILTYYGLLFLLGLPFLGLRARPLAVLAGCWLVVLPIVSHLLRPHLPARGFDLPEFDSLGRLPQLLSELTFTGYYPAVPWLAYLLAGMAIGRLDLRRTRTALLLLAAGAALAVAARWLSGVLTGRPDAQVALRSTYDPFYTPSQAELDSILTHGLFGVTPTESWWWLTVVAPHSTTPFDLAHTIGSAVAVIGVCLLAGSLQPRVFAVVLGAGAMTLTLYTAHVIMLTPEIWPPDGPSYYDTQLFIVLGTGALFGFARVRGPLEALTAFASNAAARLVRAALTRRRRR